MEGWADGKKESMKEHKREREEGGEKERKIDGKRQREREEEKGGERWRDCYVIRAVL